MRYCNLLIVVFLVHLKNRESNGQDGKQISIIKSLYDITPSVEENSSLATTYNSLCTEIARPHREERKGSKPLLKDSHYELELSGPILVKSNISFMVEELQVSQAVSSMTVISVIQTSLLFVNDDKVSQMSGMIWQLLEMEGCNAIVVTSDSNRPLLSSLLRYVSLRWKPITVIDLSKMITSNPSGIVEAIWTQTTSLCQALLVDLTAVEDDSIFRYLEESRLWFWPHANIVLIGNSREARSTLQHTSLRNSLKILYVGLENVTTSSTSTGPDEYLHVYTRCLYCKKGDPKVLFLFSWVIGSKKPQDIRIPEDNSNLHGHLLRVASYPYSPFSDYIQNENGPGGIVIPRDSLDKRLLEEVSAKMNFRYELRSPKEMQFGVLLENGSWIGAVGAIYKKEADFTTTLTITSERYKVIDLERTIEADRLVIISSKPELLPQYLVFFRPLTGEVWLYLMLTIMLWGVSLWILQRIWAHFSNTEGMTFNTAIFYSWAVILEDPPSKPPYNITGQMLVGWWLFTCLLITTYFKSSLVAHLTVEGKTPPIDTYKELVDRPGWQWGIDKQLIAGMIRYYFRDNIHSEVRYIYKHREEVYYDEGLVKARQGGYSYLATKTRMQYIISSFYADEKGTTPFYIGKQSYELSPDLGWGFRKGAPFRSQISKLVRSLSEAGISDYWLQDVIASKIKRNRDDVQQERKQQETTTKSQEVEEQRTLRMIHMMGVYLTLVVGLVIASLVFATEKVIHTHLQVH